MRLASSLRSGGLAKHFDVLHKQEGHFGHCPSALLILGAPGSLIFGYRTSPICMKLQGLSEVVDFLQEFFMISDA
jgi:hypothetical protein